MYVLMYVYADNTKCIIQMADIKHTYGTFSLYSHYMYICMLVRPPVDYVLAAAL